MKFPPISTALFFAILFLIAAADVNDNGNCQTIDGNWYCQSVSAISYSNFGSPGNYSKVISMADGKCDFGSFSYSGGMAPLDREVSWHFRGPLRLKQFAYYIPGPTAPVKRAVQGYDNGHPRTSGHKGNQPNRTVTTTIMSTAVVTVTILKATPSTHKNGAESMIYETVDGKVTSYSNPYYVLPPTSDASTLNSTSTSTSTSALTSTLISTSISPSTSSFASTSASVDKSSVTTISTMSSSSISAVVVSSASTSQYNWVRQAYYQAESQISQNIVFLNNKGGQSSGVWDQTWGNSLSYASPDGINCSPSSQILSDILIPDASEISLFTGTACTGSSCGAVRPGSVAYHGFTGSSKLFLLEFSMPLSGKTGSFQADTPSAWILNAEIPRTQQYGDCSCDASGCGEWDIFEALDSGNTRCKSTFHRGLQGGGGESDYFDRPVNGPIKVAVVFDGFNSTGHIVVLDSDFGIEEVIAEDQITNLISKITQRGQAKVFRLPD